MLNLCSCGGFFNSKLALSCEAQSNFKLADAIPVCRVMDQELIFFVMTYKFSLLATFQSL